jgi:hypothetical protein
MIRMACFVLALLIVPAKAQAPSYGFGSGKCSAYLSDITQRGEVARALYFSWAQGFLSATNGLMLKSGVPTITNFTAKIANTEQQTYLDERCKAEPDKDFAAAVLELLDRLRVAEGLNPILATPLNSKP